MMRSSSGLSVLRALSTAAWPLPAWPFSWGAAAAMPSRDSTVAAATSHALAFIAVLLGQGAVIAPHGVSAKPRRDGFTSGASERPTTRRLVYGTKGLLRAPSVSSSVTAGHPRGREWKRSFRPH